MPACQRIDDEWMQNSAGNGSGSGDDSYSPTDTDGAHCYAIWAAAFFKIVVA